MSGIGRLRRLRRRKLLGLLGAGGLVPLGADAYGLPESIAPTPRSAPGRRFLTEAEARFIRAAVDRLIPADGFPSASEAGVVDYIDLQLASGWGRGERMYLQGPHHRGTARQGDLLPIAPARLYREALLGVAAYFLDRRPFDSRPAVEQDAFLRRLEADELMLGSVPSAVFFELLRANTIEGWFSDPLHGGNRDMAGWRMIRFPGAPAQFVKWVDRHDMRFDRRPISIGEAHRWRNG